MDRPAFVSRDLDGVRGGDEGFPVSLCMVDGRLVLRGVNEGGFGVVEIDFSDLLRWLESLSPSSIKVDDLVAAATLGNDFARCQADA